MRKYIYHIASLITLLMLSFCGFAQNGTPANPYPIQGKTALITFAECINTGQKFSFENGEFVFNPNGDIPAHGASTYFEQTADIDLDGEAWVMIGNSLSTGFRGTYIGGGYKIQHLTLTANNPAMFLYPNGTIQNLTIENPVFNGTINYGGALATFVMGGTIDSCRVTGNNLVFNGKDCGALIGWVGIPNGDKAGEVTISHCSNSCNITSHYQQESFTDYYNSVAGVVACIKAERYHVTHCFNTGNITSTYRPQFQKDTICFAGVVGRGYLPTHTSEITYCYNTGDITAHCGYLGGVAGFFNEEVGVTNYTRCAIDYCFNTGNITGIPVFHVDNPTAYVYADTNLDVFSLGGVVAPSKTKTRFCFNAGNVTLRKHPHPRFVINGEQGVAGVGSSAEHCFNVGEINNYNLRNGRAAGVGRDTANHCFNAACVDDRNPRYTFSPHNISQVTISSASDAQMSVDGQDGNLYCTAKLMGQFSAAKNSLGTDYWIYEVGRYPRLKWTDTCVWARDIAKVACTPIVLADTVDDIRHVKNGIQFFGCDSGVVWKAPAGNCLFDDQTLAHLVCNENTIVPQLMPECREPVIVAATWNGDTIKTVTLLRSVPPSTDTLTVDSLGDLRILRDGVNTAEAFFYKHRYLPRYAEGVAFKLTTDLDMQNERPWIPIGSVFSGSRFSGTFLGDGHIIDNLSLDDDSVYFYRISSVGGLFGMLSGEVRDLHFTNVQAESTVIVAGAVCALMNGGTIENCVVEGRIETTTSNNNFAISGIAGIAGVSLTAHTQDNTLTCRDTIRNCVNYADIITHVRRGTNIASHSAGGIIGHGGVVINCANAGDISGGAECGYIGGIGGDLTTALRCFNTGRISIAKSPQNIDYYVGGVVGINGYPHTVQYCYNAGPVDGSDRNHVGGIMGEGSPEYCYLSNTVTSTGKHLGSITASSPNSPNHCYYDNQMSPIGGMDSEGSIEGRATTAMLGTALQNKLGVDTLWVFSDSLYPQLTSLLTLNSQLSTVSAMPVLLDADQTWATAHDNFSMGGCDEHHFWKKIRGSVDVNGCNIFPGAHPMGVLEFAATYDSVPCRHITLKYNLDSAHALIIKNADEFNNMRKVINNAGGGYYRFDDNTFHLTVPTGDYIDVKDGGNERFFKLIGDIDLSSRDWIPIGGFEESCCDLYRGTTFKGTFDGCGHTIRNLKILWVNGIDTCNRYQGLFGTIDGGTVKNLRITQNDENKSISNSALLCAVNRGTLYNCEIDSCELTVAASNYSTSLINMDTVSLLCGVNDGGLIDSCRVKNSQIVINKNKSYSYSVLGGVCGLNKQGTVQNCQVSNLYFEELRSTANTPATQAVGGICGINFHGQLLHDTIKNSRFLFSASLEHQNIGGICGINGSDDKDENRYTDISSIVENCLSDSTIIKCDTCIQGSSSCQKMAMNFGGIVGMSQGHIVQINSCATTAGSRLEVAADSVGGICGRFVGLGDESLISNCNNTAPVKGYGYVGGIVGLVTNAILVNNHNTGNVWSAWDATFGSQSGRPSGYYAGGIAGACIRRVVAMTCSNKAKIKADSSYVGGIVGALLDSCELIDCANNSVDDNEPDVIGINQVGGLVGLLGQDAWFGTGYNSVNNGCVNNGSVKGIAQVGGLVGYAKEGHLQCEGNNTGTVQGASMTGLKYGHAEDPSLFEACTSNLPVPEISPIVINDEVALKAFRDAVNNGSNSYEGQTIELGDQLGDNIYLGNDWIPIGTPKHPFRGTFDGGGKSVHFLINAPDSNYRGFFGYMEGTVMNLYLDNCNVTGHDYVGGIAGYCHGTIAYCGTKASCVVNSKVSGNKYVGGLVGMARYSEIFYNQNGSNVSGNQYVGGIVGDYVAYKNDNSYGKLDPAEFGASQYDIYGGYVSRCFNFGMVKATNDDSYVGGIAGSTSTEVNHSYNSGIVDGKDKVGGIAGQLQGDSIHHCYNTGYVSATGTNKGAVCGMCNEQCTMYNCFYDRQMCTVEDANATARYTREMTGETLKSILGNDYWTYHDNEYPKTKYWDDIHSDAAVVSVKPLLLPGYMPVDDILQNFAGSTGNTDQINISWSHYGNATPTIEIIQPLPGRDTIQLINCGMDTLEVQSGNPCEHRLVPIKVTGKDASVTTDTACTSYTWQVGDKTYTLTESGFYTDGEDCNHQYALNLTVANISCSIDQIGSTCETIPDGALISTVTGGFGNGFRYEWRDSNNTIIGQQASITNLGRGNFYLTVTDSAVTRCAVTDTTALEVQPTVALTIAGCSESKPYDGTALTGTRFVVREEGRAPDTIVANKFAVLSNGDTVRVTLASGSVTTFGTLSDTVIIKSYTIKNGIDHSCHYSVTTDSGSLSITKRPVLIKVDDASKDFGDPDPDFSGTVTGLVNAGDIGEITYMRKHPNEQAIKTYVDELTADATNMNNPNYEVAIDEGEFIIHCRSLAKLFKWFPDVTNINDCFSPTNTDTLPSASDIQKMIADSNNIDINAITVTTRDSVLSDDHCDWKWARIYSISANISNNNSGFCDVESRVLFVSGGDQTAPVRSDNYLWTYGTLPQNACLASFNIDLFFPKDQDLFDDCSPMTITHTQDTTGNDRDGWTIRRSYVVTDACDHTIHDSVKVSGRDLTPPVASNSKVKNNTLWADSAQCLCDSIHVINDFDELVSLFGLSDECTGNDISLVSKTKTLKTGDHCADTVVVAYIVADLYGNDTTFYHAQFIQDTTRPTFDIVPKDTTLCLIGTGKYKETVNSVIYDEHNQVINRVANIHDNCTKLQGSFVVHDSIDSVNYTVVNGIRQYEQYWTVTDSCGNVDTNKMIIKVNPLPTIRIDTLGTQTITYGEMIQDITIYNEYSTLSVTLGEEGLNFNSNNSTVSGSLDSAGTYSYTATATSNQTPSCGSVDTVIKIYVNPRPITIAAGSATKKYDGTPLTSPYYECTVIDYDNMQVWVPILNVDSIAGLTITGSQTDVGSSANVPSNAVITRRTDATVNMNSSYDVTYDNGTLTVTTNDTLIKVIPADGSKEYDGTPLTKTAHEDFTVTGVPEGLTWEATADGTVTNVNPGAGEKAVNAVTSFKIKDANGQDVTAFFTNIQDSIGTLKITPKTLTITAASDSMVYDGTTLTNSTYTHTALAPGDSLWSVTVTGSQTFAGTSDNVPSAAVIKNAAGDTVTANYDITYKNGTLEVTQKSLTITVNNAEKIYGQSDPTFTGTANGLLNANDLGTITFVRTNTDEAVGTYENVLSATFTSNNNYNVTIDSGNFTIHCRNIVEPTAWPADLTEQNSCFGNADTTGLYDASEVKALFANSNHITNVGEFTVAESDNATKDGDCDWEWTRTYTISVTGGCASTTKMMSVSGADRTKPTFTVPASAIVCGFDDGSFDINPQITGTVTALSDNCSAAENLVVSYTNGDTVNLSNGKRQIIRSWKVTDACGNDSVQTQVITINPAVEISVTPDLQTIVFYESITPVTVTSQHSAYITSAISLNNVATSFAAAGLEVQETAQGLQVSGTPTDTGTCKLLFTAISDQFPVCYPKQAEATIAVRMMQDTVKVVSDTASKIYDGTPLTCHRYVVTLGQDTIPADEGSNGLIFSVHFHDKLVITPVSSLTNVGTIDNEFTCVLDHPEHYKGLKKEFGTLTVNRASLSMSLDTARAYNGHPFVVTADQLHVTGLAENDTITAGTITTDGYTAGIYVCEEGGFHAYMDEGVAEKSGFAINHGLNNYEPKFEVRLTINPITEGFNCPADLHIVLTEGTSDTMVTLPANATLTPMVDNIFISNNLATQNPMSVGTHTVVWTLSDDQGNVMTTCEQTVTVEYAPCLGVSYHGHDYDAVRVGPQCWLTEDLRWATGNHRVYHGDDSNVEKFGYLYSWYTAVGVDENDNTTALTTLPAADGTRYVRGICPEGWGVCSKADVELLVLSASGTDALKDVSPLYWLSGHEGTLPTTGFAARAGGWYNSTMNRYEDLMTGYHFWKADDPGTTTEVTTTTVISCLISIWCDRSLFESSLKTDMRSVRCIRKAAPLTTP